MGYLSWIIICSVLCTGLTYAETVDVVPLEYDLYFKTDPEHFEDSPGKNLVFEGKVEVLLKFENDPENGKFDFVMNVVPQTEVKSVELLGDEYEKLNTTFKKEKGLLKVECNGEETKEFDLFRLVVVFSNPFRNDMSGFYRSSYKVDGKNRWLLTTHFEPIYARRAYPCFDKPDLKAYFNVSIAVPLNLDKYNVLCNAPLDKKEVQGEHSVTRCKKTSLPMSTYLVAFTVSDFEKTESLQFLSDYPESTPRLITTYGRKSIIDHDEAEVAQKAGLSAVELLGKYLEKGYAFEKVDQVGIPDFSAGAMENWGLILFREKALFVNESKTTSAIKQNNVLTITHELVHQWFGNLVTLESWNYIWLNEAFATYLSYVIAAQITHPMAHDWDYMGQILAKEVHAAAMETDGIETSQPMSQDIKDENLISPAFNDIPYAKGASILRMWDLSLEEDKFRQSLVDYVNRNAQGNTSPDDLFASFSKVANMSKDFFDKWHKQPGYPVVNVEKKNGTNKYVLTQNRFLWEKQPNRSEHIKYEVPISYTTADKKDFSTKPVAFLNDKPLELTFDSQWFVINNKQAGYYKVNYNKENWEALADALYENHLQFHKLTRAQLVNDALTLARSVQTEYVPYDLAFRLTRFLRKEYDYVVWNTALKAFEYLQTKLSQNEELYPKFRDYVMHLLEPHFKHLDRPDDTHLEKLMSSQVARWACALNYQPCIDEANKFYSNASKFPDSEEVILCTVVRNNKDKWSDVFEKYKNEFDSSRKVMYLHVLGCTNDTEQASAFLNSTLKEDSGIRKQDLTFALAAVYNGGYKNVEVAFEFVKNNFAAIAKEYGGINPLGKAITGLARRLYTGDHVKQMDELIAKIKNNTDVNVSGEDLDSAVRVLISNEYWMREKTKQLKSSFNSGSRLYLSFSLFSFSLILYLSFLGA